MNDEEQEAGIPEWVVTFGDMMSLLLTFFIMLVSLSEIKEEEKYQALVDSFRQQFGHDSSVRSLIPGSSRPRNSKVAKLATAGRARRLDTHRGGDKTSAPVGDSPRVLIVRPGKMAGIATRVYFEPGDIELTDEARAILLAQAREMGGKPQRIEVRGHTSRRPLDAESGFHDHWDLAYQRSHTVMEHLIDLGIASERLRLSVAGPNEPRFLNQQPDEAGRNGRVEVFMLDEVVKDLQGTADEREQRYLAPGLADSATSDPPG